MLKKNKLIIILIGPPGAGKGTQASLLADRLGLYYLETSKIIEAKVSKAKPNDYQIVKGQKYYLLEEKKNWEQGRLCSPPLVAFWIIEKIKELFSQGQGIVFAGSPRSVYEAKEIMPLIKKLYQKKNITVILFTLSAKQSIWRNSHRRICELLRHPILYNDQTKNLKYCPLDGSKLFKRSKLDDPETIKIRLQEYKKRTLPLIDYLKNQGFLVQKISAAPAPAVVFKRVLRAIS